jgi:hypothetical protein
LTKYSSFDYEEKGFDAENKNQRMVFFPVKSHVVDPVSMNLKPKNPFS